MFNPDSLKEINIIKQNSRQTVLLVEDVTGKKYLKRQINGDKREIYKTLQKINHSNIPKIHYVEFNSDTVVIEEYIDGVSLNGYMERGTKLSKKQICSISKQILSALATLHKTDIIHRDIKPDNILIDKLNHVWLTDYDISRIYREEVRRDTETMGTFGYAPIEQYGMLPTDFKTDIYAFGVTLKTLLDYAKVKGFLCRIAEKCKRLDPAQRYKSAEEVQKAITFNSLVYPTILTIVLVVAILFCIRVWDSTRTVQLSSEQEFKEQHIESEVEGETTPNPSKNIETDNMQVIIKENEKKQPEVKTETEKPVKENNTNDTNFEGTFLGFSSGEKETEYSKYNFFSQACIFSMDKEWEHVLFLDDINKTGKLKIGKNNTIIDADITLNNGCLSVKLNDGKGKTYSGQFEYNNQYEYTKSYTNDLRKNADIICYDFDGDGGNEILIGLNEGVIGVIEKQFYNNLNYCIAWCIRYDENTGFTLCDGDMFSKGYSFWINNAIRKVNVSWEDIGDITGYLLEGNKIIPN